MTRRDVGIKVMEAIGLPETIIQAFQKGTVYVTDDTLGLTSPVDADSEIADRIAKVESYGGLVFAVIDSNFLLGRDQTHMVTYLFIADEYVDMAEDNVNNGRPITYGFLDEMPGGQFRMLALVDSDMGTDQGSVMFARRGAGLVRTA